MEIYINLLKEKDAEELFIFESVNRRFFEKSVPSRGENYYIFENFLKQHRALLKEQKEGISYFYLIRDISDSIVGRINLVDIDREKKLGYLGYRVGEAYIGRGIANQAVKLLIKESERSDILEIHAKPTSFNKPSQSVLGKNNFIITDHREEEIDFNGQKGYFIHYIRKNGM